MTVKNELIIYSYDDTSSLFLYALMCRRLCDFYEGPDLVNNRNKDSASLNGSVLDERPMKLHSK